MSTLETGRRAETMAAEYLQAKGMKLLERNWRHRHCELDLIMEDGKALVFVEVKARSGTEFGLPTEAVNRSKRRHLVYAAEAYLVTHQATDRFCRFDVVEVYLADGRIRHIPDAFWAN